MINSNEYKLISDALSDAQLEGDPMLLGVSDMLTSLQNNQVRDTDEEKLRLEQVIESSYELILLNHKSVNQNIISMTTSLQEHVTHHAGSVDNFISSGGFKVSEVFSQLSTLAGYPITNANNIE
jgi:hypothetical protein